MWVLASYGVRPGLQGRGIGRQLLEAATHHGRGCLRAMLSASARPDGGPPLPPGRVHAAPADVPHRQVDRAVAPGGREGPRGQRRRHRPDELRRPADPRRRAPRPDHELLLGQYRLVVSDTSTGSGYVYVDGPARRSCWPPPTAVPPPGCCGRRSPPPTRWSTSTSPTSPRPTTWAVDVGMAARMELHTSGLPGAARDEAAGAVPAPRLAALTCRLVPNGNKSGPGRQFVTNPRGASPAGGPRMAT